MSEQLRLSQEQVVVLEEERGRMGTQLAQARGREEQLRQQLRERESQWRVREEELEQVRSVCVCVPP